MGATVELVVVGLDVEVGGVDTVGVPARVGIAIGDVVPPDTEGVRAVDGEAPIFVEDEVIVVNRVDPPVVVVVIPLEFAPERRVP